MSTRIEILKLLTDGRFHSGTDVGRTLGVTRAAVCKNIKALSDSGLDVHRIPGRGYRLAEPVKPLDKRRILEYLANEGIDSTSGCEILEEVDSTNRYLLEYVDRDTSLGYSSPEFAGSRRRNRPSVGSASPGSGLRRPASDTGAPEENPRKRRAFPHGAICLAEVQRQGRGRRGRSWIASPYSNVMLSMGWRFESGAGFVSGLSLAAGVALARALGEFGVADVGLKWPNDVVWRERKLAGVLADIQGEASGPCLIVLGVGVNGRIREADARRIDQPWVDLQTIMGIPVDRDRLAALTVKHLTWMFRLFEQEGLDGFREEWQRRHLYHGRHVRVLREDAEFHGTVIGIDKSGGLRLRDAGGTERVFHSGEVSLRLGS